ncbi:Arylsulfatase precursor [Thalassoglobus neptunius]|uniref:Arylsulfatase n=1 Tax=Thalassoglobus neptunius TaxID=1938619 RepID=A0A5C5X6A0_9PLAN|nr:sulfatase [Thalassoglobus neptunius]TWT58298.1 Arylsulfatase precursor [Thalassoglobus neptunius]
MITARAILPVFLVLFFHCFALCAIGDQQPPNVILLLIDDQGYYDLGCYGATEFRTPEIDRLAAEGIRFTDYYAAAPICSPSRAGLLTGCYPRRVGLETWVQRADSRVGLNPDELTLAELFSDHGYATACIGKWHLGFHEPFLPMNQGFDEYFGLLHNLDPVETRYFEQSGGVPVLRGNEVVKRPADPNELTKIYTDEAIKFITENREDPFLLYLPHTMLHNPLGVSEEFRGTSDFGEYGDAIQELDFHVGRLVSTLKQLDLDQQTIIVYLSDNGRGPGRNSQQPLIGRKLTTFEAGIRVPAIVWGPGLGIDQGRVSQEMIHAMDWFPTLSTFAGISVPEERIIDGRDLSALLTGKASGIDDPMIDDSLNGKILERRPWDPGDEWKELVSQKEFQDAFFYHGSEGALAAVRWKQWKLVLNPSLKLYDLESDPSESTPVRNPIIIRKLRGMAVLFQEEMRDGEREVGRIVD